MTLNLCKNACGRILAPFIICLLLAGSLWAQTSSSSDGQSNSISQKSASIPALDVSGTKPHDDHFVIGNDDMLAVNVWKEPDISRSIPVRSDGRISLPLVGEVQAAGKTPLSLEQEIAARLKNYISEP
jgi:polysaccharide export outer membrane protein